MAVVATDRAGNVYLTGRTGGSLYLAKLDSTGSRRLWRRLVGSAGPADEDVTALAVDGDGNAYLAGWTASAGFPLVNPLQSGLNGARDAFLMKVDPSGERVLYSTFLGGADNETATGLAVDARGAVHIVGETSSSDFPVTGGAWSRRMRGPSDAFAAKIAPRGDRLEYATYLGGEGYDGVSDQAIDGAGRLAVLLASSSAPPSVIKLDSSGSAAVYVTTIDQPETLPSSIASDAAGNVWVAGFTESLRFTTTADALQSRLQGFSSFRSTDRGASFLPAGEALPSNKVFDFASAADKGSRIYAATAAGVFRSEDNGATWTAKRDGLPPGRIVAIAAARAVYAVHELAGVFRSRDDGYTWQRLLDGPFGAVAIDPQDPSVVYAGGERLMKSTDGGDTWTAVVSLPAFIRALAVDPNNPAIVLAATELLRIKFPPGGLMRSVDGGRSFETVIRAEIRAIRFDPHSPGHVYAASHQLYRSFNSFETYSAASIPFGAAAVALDPEDPGSVYAMLWTGEVRVSKDGGDSFEPLPDSPWMPRAWALHVSAGSVLHAGGEMGGDAFVMRLDAAGRIVFSTLLGGRFSESVSRIALDAGGRLWAAGYTASRDFPATDAGLGPRGDADVLVLALHPDGSLAYSTALGGGGIDYTSSIAVTPDGAIWITGETYSTDYPLVNPADAEPAYFRLFLARLR